MRSQILDLRKMRFHILYSKILVSREVLCLRFGKKREERILRKKLKRIGCSFQGDY